MRKEACHLCAVFKVSSERVYSLLLQVATANLAWASVAIHQVQVSVSGFFYFFIV